MAPSKWAEILDFDVDRYFNPYIPHNRLYILPKPVSHFLGYRERPTKEPYAALQWPVTILATIAGLCLVGGLNNHTTGLLEWHPPVLIASLGASAVLDFNTIRSPLAQPRNSIIGNTLSALCGVCVAKLFQLNPNFNDIQWVAAAFGCALASWVMSVTNTIHPPGGATAVLASTEAAVIAMGWKYIGLVVLDSTLMVCVALIFNNLFRQYPMYWWTGSDVGHKLRHQRRDAEAQETKEAEDSSSEVEGPGNEAFSDTSSDRTLRRELSNGFDNAKGSEHVHILPDRIQLPPHMKLSAEEASLLEAIQHRLRPDNTSAA